MSRVFLIGILVLVDLLGETFLFIFQVDYYAFLPFEDYQGLLQIGLAHRQDLVQFVFVVAVENLFRRLFLLDDIFFRFFLFFAFLLIGAAFLLLRFLFLDLTFFAIAVAIGIDDNFLKLFFILHEKLLAAAILALVDDVSSMDKLVVGEVGVSVFAFLLEIW